jgi:hypothetical protein
MTKIQEIKVYVVYQDISVIKDNINQQHHTE